MDKLPAPGLIKFHNKFYLQGLLPLVKRLADFGFGDLL